MQALDFSSCTLRFWSDSPCTQKQMSGSLWCEWCHAEAQYWHVSNPSREKLEKLNKMVYEALIRKVQFHFKLGVLVDLFCFVLVWFGFFFYCWGGKSLLLWKNYLEFPRTSGFQKWEVTLFTQTDQAYRQVQKLLLCFHLQNFVRHREHSVNVPPTPTPGDLFLLDLEEAWRDNSHWKRKRGVLFSGPGLYKYQCPTRAQLGWLMGMMGGRQR